MDKTSDSYGKALVSKEARSHPYFVSTLEKGMRILTAFYAENGDLSLTDICKVTGLEKSTVQRLTHTLVELGLISKDSRNRKYFPAPQMLDFSYTYLHSDALSTVAAPYLIDAREESKEAVNMARMVGTNMINTYRIPPSRRGRNLNPIPGSRVPAFCTATGRSILSCYSEDEVSRILDNSDLLPLTTKTITDRDVILERIERARIDGFTICVEECRKTEITVAAPIVNQDNLPIAAINISATTNRWDEEKVRAELAPIIVQTASEITHAQGFNAASRYVQNPALSTNDPT